MAAKTESRKSKVERRKDAGPRVTTDTRFADGGARASIACGTCKTAMEYQAALDMTVGGWVEGLGRLGWQDIQAFSEAERANFKTSHLGTCPACVKRLGGAPKADGRKPRTLGRSIALPQAASRKPDSDSGLASQDSSLEDGPPPEGLGASSEYQVRFVPIAQVVPTRENPRFLPQSPEKFAELVASVKVDGILQPLLGRPHPEPDKHHLIDLRAGSRRLAAARAAGLSEVPVIVRPMSDAQAASVTAWENLGREDLHPLEEAAAIELLRKSGLADATIAERMGRSVKWVARRASLVRLSPAWRDAIRAGTHPILAEFSAGHFEAVARLPEAVQDQVLESELGAGSRAFEIPTVETWVDNLAALALDLSGAPWKLDDADLVAAAGACVNCPKRTGANPVLFDLGPKGGDQCLDATCWQRKTAAVIAAKRKDLAAAHGSVLLVGDRFNAERSKVVPKKDVDQLVEHWKYEKVKAGTAGAKPAVEVTGPGAGRTVWLKPVGRGGGGAGEKPKVDPREAVERRRRKRFVGLVHERLLAKKDGAFPDVDDVWRLVYFVMEYGHHNNADQLLAVWPRLKKDLGAIVWDKVCAVMVKQVVGVAREFQAEPADVKAAELLATLFSLDPKALHAEVEAEHPLPGKGASRKSKVEKRGGLASKSKTNH